MLINKDDVTGQSNRYIECWQMNNQLLLHAKVVSPLTHLQQAAATAGFDLQVVSGYRSFDDQLLLWNDKFQGRREVLNDEGEAVDMQALSPLARIQAVMRWTALKAIQMIWRCVLSQIGPFTTAVSAKQIARNKYV